MSHVPKDSFSPNNVYQQEPGTSTAPAFNTAPSHYKTQSQSQLGVDEFGYGRQDIKMPMTEAGGRSNNYAANDPYASSKPTERPGSRRPGTAGSQNQNRYTVTNLHEDDEAALVAIGNTTQAPITSPPANSGSPQNAWLSAEEEKKRLYENATANVARVQGSVVSQSPTPQAQTPVRLSL